MEISLKTFDLSNLSVQNDFVIVIQGMEQHGDATLSPG